MMVVARTTVDVDRAALVAAQAALGTRGLSATANTALREVARRSVLRTSMWCVTSRGPPPRWSPGARAVAGRKPTKPKLAALAPPSLLDTAVWTWARDRRYPGLAD